MGKYLPGEIFPGFEKLVDREVYRGAVGPQCVLMYLSKRSVVGRGMCYVCVLYDQWICVELWDWIYLSVEDLDASLRNLPRVLPLRTPKGVWDIGEPVLGKCYSLADMICALDSYLFKNFVRSLTYDMLLVLRRLSVRHRVLVDVCGKFYVCFSFLFVCFMSLGCGYWV